MQVLSVAVNNVREEYWAARSWPAYADIGEDTVHARTKEHRAEGKDVCKGNDSR